MNVFNLAALFVNAELITHVLTWVHSSAGIGIIAFIVLYILATIALLPGAILTLGAGFLFGVVPGSLYVLIGALIGETCAFLLGRYVARDWIAQKFANNQTFVSLDKALQKEGLKIILLTRLSPIFPFSLLNYGFGITGISLKNYFIGSIGMIPMTVAYVYFGSLAEDIVTLSNATKLGSPELQWTIKIVGLVATIAVTFIVTRIARQALNKSLAEA